MKLPERILSVGASLCDVRACARRAEQAARDRGHSQVAPLDVTGLARGGGPGELFRRSAAHAYLIAEALVYLGVLFLLLGVGYVALYRCMDNSIGLRRNADDIAAAVRAGERWRADVRAAEGQPRLEHTASEQILRLRTHRGEIAYRFSENAVFRQVGAGPSVRLLENVKSSAMTSEARQQARAFRWEVELQTRKKTITRTRPLFTFVAVPATKD